MRITKNKLHWNYFLALEKDLETLSRYVEFSENNFNVYSIELAHLLFAAASEVDVMAKCICEILSPTAPRDNINDYRSIILDSAHLPSIPAMQVFIPRYGMKLTPWENWAVGNNPDWWRSYNNVKHERNQHFDEATLKNALNALGGLLILNFHFYRFVLAGSVENLLQPKDTTRGLKPDSTLLRLPDHYYDSYLMIE